MSKKKKLTHASGAPVTDNQNTMTAGPRGPVPVSYTHLTLPTIYPV